MAVIPVPPRSSLSSSSTSAKNKAATSDVAASLIESHGDIITELADNRDHYYGDKVLVLYSTPGFIVGVLNRIRTHCFHYKRPGLSVTAATCIGVGLKHLKEDEGVMSLISMNESLADIKGYDEISGDVLDSLNLWFQSFPLGAFDSRSSGNRQQTFSVPEWLKSAVGDVANSTGISGNTVATMAIAYSLLDDNVAPHVHKDYLVRMRRYIETLGSLMEVRYKVGEAMMMTLGLFRDKPKDRRM